MVISRLGRPPIRPCRRRAARLVLFCLAAMLALPTFGMAAAASEWTVLADNLRVRRLADGLWLHESETQWGSSTVAANGLVAVGSAGAVLLDTPWTNEQTASLLDWIERELGARVLAVVVSHFHPDAAGGLAEVHRRGIESWGHELTGPLASGESRPAPRRSVRLHESLSTGTEALEILYLGPGHARDNVVVWFPARRLLFGGCAVKAAAWSGLGFTGDADLERWPQTLRAAADLHPEIVVPGHGEPGGPELLAHTLELLAGSGVPGEPRD